VTSELKVAGQNRSERVELSYKGGVFR
jgi:hypothetical protein